MVSPGMEEMSYVCQEHTRPCGLQRVKSVVILRLSSLFVYKKSQYQNR